MPTDQPHPEPPQYEVAHLRQILAEDPRTSELGVRVAVRGAVIHLAGEVTCDQRRDQILAVVREVAGDRPVRSDIHVTAAGEPTESEELR